MMLRGLGSPEISLVLVIVELLFGAGRIGKLASEFTSGLRAFREALKGENKEVSEG